jgi:3-isopropylmalate dehydrogenase
VEGLYASRGAGTNVRDEVVTDTLVITREGTEKVVRRAFELARSRAERFGRPAKVTCVDKANVLASYAFFRKVFD